MIEKLVELLLILVFSAGAVLIPVVNTLPPAVLFVCRHFGSGVILATGLVHLLQPANEALEGVCEFPLAYALSLLAIFVVIVIDGLQRRNGHAHSHGYVDVSDGVEKAKPSIGSLLILESGIVFHSIFIGISCALSSGPALAIAITVHQTFEGLGLGARLGSFEWDKPWKPVVLAWAYALATPMGMLIGLVGFKSSKTVTGVFDALSSGVLLYTGLVELIANELLSDTLDSPLAVWAAAYLATLVGAGAMTAMALWV